MPLTLWQRKPKPVAADPQASPPERPEDDGEFAIEQEKYLALVAQLSAAENEFETINERRRNAYHSGRSPLQDQTALLLQTGELHESEGGDAELPRGRQLANQLPILKRAIAQQKETVDLIRRRLGHRRFAELCEPNGELTIVRQKQVKLADELRKLLNEESRFVNNLRSAFGIEPSCDCDREKAQQGLAEISCRKDC